jgi:plasmid stabilization system protein ParE
VRGRSSPPGLRSVVEGSSLIFYYPRPEGPEIVRILHGKRNITSDLF